MRQSDTNSRPRDEVPAARGSFVPDQASRVGDSQFARPCAPVTYRGMTYVIAQLNNAMIYPGLSLGAIVSRASRISEGMLEAAAGAVSSLVSVRHPGASLLPHIDDLSCVSMTVAATVAEAALSEGLSRAPIE